MALTVSDIPDLMLPGLRAEFDLAYRAKIDDAPTERLATVINTTQPVQRYGWLGAAPSMREFIDERQPPGLSAFTVSIADRTFESTIAVERRAIEDDQLDLIRLRIRDLAERVAAHRHQMIVEALVAGQEELCYDGTPMFGSGHPTGAGTTSNVVSSDLNSAALREGTARMMSFADDAGLPLGIVPDMLLVGPQNMWTALELVESSTAPGAAGDGSKNVFQGRLKVVVSPFLRDENANSWFLLDTSRPIRAAILQQRSDVPVEFSALEATNGSERAFFQDRFHYGVRARYNVGYGLWSTALMGVNV